MGPRLTLNPTYPPIRSRDSGAVSFHKGATKRMSGPDSGTELFNFQYNATRRPTYRLYRCPSFSSTLYFVFLCQLSLILL